jgi:archaemetzincin
MPLTRRRLLAGLPCLPLAACATDEAARGPFHVRPAPLVIRTPAPWKAGLGPLDDVPPDLRPAFADAHGYEVLPPPGPRGWRVLRPEPPQTVADFIAFGANTRTAPRDRITLLPLGEFPLEVVADERFVALVRTPELVQIADLLAAFYATPVDILPALPYPAPYVPRRLVRGHAQYDARALLDLVARKLPGDAHSMLALVNVDLYVFQDQRYAFGWSTLRDRIGVVGFARLDPSNHGGPAPLDPTPTLLRRGLRVAAHEVGHMFGLGHCQAFRCLMNGMSDLDELDATPLRLCPLCLRKLHLVTGLDPRARDLALLAAFDRLGLAEDRDWLAERAHRLWPDRTARAD